MPLRKWQVQSAKNKLSEVIQQAMNGEPQLITKNGRPAVYVISVNDYEKLTCKKDLKQLLLSSPHKEMAIPLERPADKGREITV